jgi:hypothetical protein
MHIVTYRIFGWEEPAKSTDLVAILRDTLSLCVSDSERRVWPRRP